jgi:phosphoglycolate phosphatase
MRCITKDRVLPTSLNPIEAILFDLDGTLVDSAPSIATILNAMRAEQGSLPLPVGCFRQWISLGAAELVSRSLAVPLPDVAAALEDFRGRYGTLPTPATCLFPGVSETLAILAESGVRLGICSNKPTHLCRKVLQETGLLAYFGAIVGGDTVPRPKPHRQPLDHAMGLLGAHPSGTIFVGDSTIDQQAANAAGLPFVFFTAGYDDGVDVEAVWARIGTMPQTLAIVRSGPGRAAADEL